MAESGPDLSEEVTKASQQRNQPEYNRRQFIAAGLGGIATLMGWRNSQKTSENYTQGSDPIPEIHMERGSEEVARLNERIGNNKSRDENSEVSSSEYYKTLTPEQKKLVDETSLHLTTIYGSKMDSRHYPTEESKLAFWKKVTELGIDISPENSHFANQLAAVMAWESGFSPDIPSNNGSDGIGLIQFSNEIPRNLHTNHDALAAMTPLEQLDYVATYYRNKRDDLGVSFFSLEDVYAAVIAPQVIGKGPKAILYEKGTKFAENNKAIDEAGDRDGNLTLSDATKAVYDTAVASGENPLFLSDPRST